jgi:molybdate transport system ATP-binding protein
MDGAADYKTPKGVGVIKLDVRRKVGRFTLEARYESSGDVTALFGPSGAGKTMLADMIAGLVRPDRGQINIAGETVFDSDKSINIRPEKRGVGYVFQEGRLFPHISVESNLCYGIARPGPGIEMKFADVVELLGLGPILKRMPHFLSGGERQRVAVGRALLSRPRLLLMDEPLASLDTARRSEILPFLESLRSQFSVPIVYVSHAMDEVARLADYLVLIDEGQVTASGPIGEVLGRLDLPGLGALADVGSILNLALETQIEEDSLSVLTLNGARLVVPALDLPIGTAVRVRVQARDVAIALVRPEKISTLNILAGTITAIEAEHPEKARHQQDVLIDVGAPLRARLTRKSVRDLGLKPGVEAFAVLKAVAVEQR